MVAEKKYDWESLEAEYVTGNESLKDFSIRKGVVSSTLYDKARAEKWTDKRAKYREYKKIEDKRSFDDKTDMACDSVASVISLRVSLHDRDGIKNVGGKLWDDTLESIKEAMSILKTVQDIKYRTLGVPAPKQSIEIEDKPKAPIEAVDDHLERIVSDVVVGLNEPGNGHGGNGNGSQ